MAPKLDAPTERELAWIADNLTRATAMAKKYGGDAKELAALDALWATWSAALRKSGGDPNPLINMVGVAFGQHLVDTAGLAWVLASDEHGTDLAVHGEPGSVLVYPCNFVAKRWQSGETEFFARTGAQLVADIKRIRGR
ncbi:MAG TPA: DUF3806 domain-containing protein [Kofleriaceae bacterium]